MHGGFRRFLMLHAPSTKVLKTHIKFYIHCSMTAARKFFENFWCTSRKFFSFSMQHTKRSKTFCYLFLQKTLFQKISSIFLLAIFAKLSMQLKKFYVCSWFLHAIKNWVEAIIYSLHGFLWFTDWVEAIIYSLHGFLWFTETLSRTNFYNYAYIGIFERILNQIFVSSLKHWRKKWIQLSKRKK